MTLSGETLRTGAPATCGDCGVTPALEILRSPAGYYIGTECACGPYTRETGYYKLEKDATLALDDWKAHNYVPSSVRR
jgi:hypothetical protein